MGTRNEVQEHQNATDCDDREMLGITCRWLDKLFATYPDAWMGDVSLEESFYSHVASSLERLPGDVS